MGVYNFLYIDTYFINTLNVIRCTPKVGLISSVQSNLAPAVLRTSGTAQKQSSQM